jgi:FAD synthetase
MRKNLKTVMAFGTFDFLHPGHKYFLRRAKKCGQHLIVVIARDSTVKQIKGKLPKQTENQRLKAILSLKLADKVILGCRDDKYAVIKKYRPDIICLGYDQSNFTTGLKKLKMKVKIVRLKSFKPNKYKTSLIMKRLNFMHTSVGAIIKNNNSFCTFR